LPKDSNSTGLWEIAYLSITASNFEEFGCGSSGNKAITNFFIKKKEKDTTNTSNWETKGTESKSVDRFSVVQKYDKEVGMMEETNEQKNHKHVHYQSIKFRHMQDSKVTNNTKFERLQNDTMLIDDDDDDDNDEAAGITQASKRHKQSSQTLTSSEHIRLSVPPSPTTSLPSNPTTTTTTTTTTDSSIATSADSTPYLPTQQQQQSYHYHHHHHQKAVGLCRRPTDMSEIDRDVFNALPPDIQKEIRASISVSQRQVNDYVLFYSN
jgi:hypothetical protein